MGRLGRRRGVCLSLCSFGSIDLKRCLAVKNIPSVDITDGMRE